MDVWMLGCISFVFGTMIELAIVCYITRQMINKITPFKFITISMLADAKAVGTQSADWLQ